MSSEDTSLLSSENDQTIVLMCLDHLREYENLATGNSILTDYIGQLAETWVQERKILVDAINGINAAVSATVT